MTEREWLDCADPATMLSFLGDRVDRRRFRLSVAGYYRHIWHLLSEAGRRAIAVDAQGQGRATAAWAGHSSGSSWSGSPRSTASRMSGGQLAQVA
jgi:hypothetical protein